MTVSVRLLVFLITSVVSFFILRWGLVQPNFIPASVVSWVKTPWALAVVVWFYFLVIRPNIISSSAKG